MKILFIDDNQNSVVVASYLLNDEIENPSIDIVGFDDAEMHLQKTQPDIVVLDLLLGAPSEQNDEGLKIEDFIWESCFCPVVVYSAEPDRLKKEHPLIKKVQKGSGSQHGVLRAVNDLKPVADMLRQARQNAKEEVDKAFSLVMREVAEQASMTFTDPERLSDFVRRSGRRRLAAMMDTPIADELASWEQYLCPPVSDDVLLADVLMTKDADKDQPESFCVVLTPSCDMVRTGGSRPKVNRVLVARCCSMLHAQRLVGLIGSNKKVKRNIKEMLNEGYRRAIIPLPKLEGVIPTMAANLRDLELIEIEKIGAGKEFEYRRVASCDSPFRELVAWAYMQNAARPGLPVRDVNTWAKEIIATHG